MAVIGNIRKHSTFLVIIIGVALAAFVLGDFAKQRTGSRDVNIGVVEGEEITIMDFNARAEQNIENKLQQQETDRLTAEEQFRTKEETWNQMVYNVIMDNEYETIGLSVTPEELYDLIQGNNPHPAILQYFSDPNTGQFDRNRIIQYLQSMDGMPAQARQQWVQFEKYIKDDRFRTKFNALLTQGYYVPQALAQQAFNEDNDKADINYIVAPYKNLADSLFVPTESDYRAYYDEHREGYKDLAMRDLQYVIFDVKPSAKDLQAATKDADDIYREFKTTVDVARFVKVNSDSPYDTNWYSQGQLPVQIDSIMFNSPVGTVAKPFLENNNYHIARLMDEAMRPDSMKASHILISYAGALRADASITRTKIGAKALADSLYAVVKKSPKKMADLAKEFSTDPSAATNSGDLGWFADGSMVPTFNEAVVDGKKGDVTVVETPFGYHVVQITGKKDNIKKVRVAMVDREVLASDQTYQDVFGQASKLASETTTLEQFNEYVKTNNLNPREMPGLREMTNRIPGLPNPRQMVQWAFNENTEVGQVSSVFDMEDMFVVAVVTMIQNAGYPTLEEVKPRLEILVTNQLKAKYLTEKMAAFNGDITKVQTDMKLDPATNVNPFFFTSRNLKGYGSENNVIGTVFGMKEGQVSAPIEGSAGVFMVKVASLTKANTPSSFEQTISKLSSAFKQSVDQEQAYNALKESLDITDNRMRFY